jgi:gluconate 2-dehydrogenase gamma chain
MTLTRRDLLTGISAIVLVNPAVALAKAGAKATAGLAIPFTNDQRAVLAAAVDRILPGAADAGVPGYLAFWLSQRAFEGLGRYITAGLGYLDKMSRKQFKKDFIDCPPKRQDEVLQQVADGELRLRRFDGRLFFQKLMELTLEGYLSDPKYGGNRDRVGWKFIGIPDGLRSCWWNPNGPGTVLSPNDGFND